MNDSAGFDNCPFCGCGSGRFVINTLGRQGDFCEEAFVACECSARMKALAEPERYEHLAEDLYRRIPRRSALDILREKWNRRAGAPSSGASRHLSPAGEGRADE